MGEIRRKKKKHYFHIRVLLEDGGDGGGYISDSIFLPFDSPWTTMIETLAVFKC